MKMRGLFLTGASFAVTTAVVTNAWMQKKQFYPTVVYLTKSSPCLAVLYVQAFVFVLLFGKLMRKIFFGQLRPAETEHLIERSWYAVTDTCLAFTMFRDDFSPIFVAAFTLLLFLKCFHWLLEDRVDYMERSPIITFIFKLRVLSLLALLMTCDIGFVNLSYHTTMAKGASVQLVFGFEYAILATMVITIFLKYVLHAIDLQSENPWENKAVYMLYVELITGFFRVILYISFTALMVKVHTFPLFSVRPMYLTMRQFKKAVSDIILSRRAIRNMNTLYPDATAEELSTTDSTCIICREDMQAPDPQAPPAGRGVSDAGVNKKLPCGHIFHATCLRSWFQRQQTCPTCRLDVLQARAPAPPPRPAPPPPPGMPPHPHMPGHPFGPMFPPMHPGMFPRPPPPPASNTTNNPSSSSTNGQAPPPPPTGASFPMFMPPPPFMAPPMPPQDFSGMTEEQVRAMEGHERRSVEARIECLRNISNLLDAAMHQVAQYATVVQSQGGPGFQIRDMPDLSNRAPPEAPSEVQSPSAEQSTSKSASTENNRNEDDIAGTSGLNSSQKTDSVTVEDNEETTPADVNELRRRRLAKLSPQQSDNTAQDTDE